MRRSHSLRQLAEILQKRSASVGDSRRGGEEEEKQIMNRNTNYSTSISLPSGPYCKSLSFPFSGLQSFFDDKLLPSSYFLPCWPLPFLLVLLLELDVVLLLELDVVVINPLLAIASLLYTICSVDLMHPRQTPLVLFQHTLLAFF